MASAGSVATNGLIRRLILSDGSRIFESRNLTACSKSRSTKAATALVWSLASQRRNYSIRDKYAFPKTKEELEAEKVAAEERAKKQAAAEAKKKEQEEKEQRKMRFAIPPTGIRSASEEVKYLQFDWSSIKQPADPKGISIAIIGAPNAGKSTLVNRLVGSRVSIVTRKAQTTREQIQTVLTQGDTQIIFVDTPGIVSAENRSVVSRDVSTAAWAALDDVDLVCVIVDAVKTIDTDLKYFFAKIQEYKTNYKKRTGEDKSFILALNKADLFTSEQFAEQGRHAVPLPDRFRFHFQELDEVFDKVFTISALNGENVSKFLDFVKSKAYDRPWLFPASFKSDMPPLKIASEVIREKIFRRINDEIPYGVYQENVGWTEFPNGDLRIDQNLIVLKKSQVAVLVGKNAENLQAIAMEAKRDLSTMFQRRVLLVLKVVYRKQVPADASISEPMIA